jgi:serine phosphatase RsbU (regulator of sigma subunit)
MAMGVVDFPSPTAQTVQLQVGDLVFLYTDGVTETPTPLGELYGENRLKSFIEKNQGIPVETLADELLKDLVRFSEDTSQFDDITIISFRVI